MGNIVMDWKNEASGGDYPVYPDGTYKVEITGWENNLSKNKGTPQILWLATVREASDKKHVGGKISCFTVLTPKALFRVANLVQACGVDLSSAGKMEVGSESFKAVLDSCIGRTTFWLVSYSPEFKNNKVEDFQRDQDQEAIQPKETQDEACPF